MHCFLKEFGLFACLTKSLRAGQVYALHTSCKDGLPACSQGKN